MIDLRIPTGLFFSATGLILMSLGVFAPHTRAVLTTANVNLYTGIVMLIFGGFMLLLAKRSK